MTQFLQGCYCCCYKLASVLSAVPVADIKAVITGKDCPHMKEKGALKQNKVCVRKRVGGCVSQAKESLRVRVRVA